MAAPRRWRVVLGLLVVRSARDPTRRRSPSRDTRFPGLPPYRYQPLNGDSFVYYAAAREFIASFGRVSKPSLLLAVCSSSRGGRGGVHLLAAIARRRWIAILFPAGAVSLALTLPIHQMHPPGAAVFGWPLLWSIPLIPIRAVGLIPTPDVAFVFGLVLALVAIAVAVVATAYVGLYATGRRSVGLRRRRLFAALAARQRPARRSSRLGERAMERRRRASPLHRAALDGARRRVGRAPAPTGHSGRTGLPVAGLAIGYATVREAHERRRRASCSRCSSPGVAVRGRRSPTPLGGLVSAPARRRLLAEGVRRHVRRGHLPSRQPWSPRTSARHGGTRCCSRRACSSCWRRCSWSAASSMRDRWVLAVVLHADRRQCRRLQLLLRDRAAPPLPLRDAAVRLRARGGRSGGGRRCVTAPSRSPRQVRVL